MDLIHELRHIREELSEMRKQMQEMQDKIKNLEEAQTIKRADSIVRTAQPLVPVVAAAPPALRPMKSIARPRATQPVQSQSNSIFDRMRFKKQ